MEQEDVRIVFQGYEILRFHGNLMENYYHPNIQSNYNFICTSVVHAALKR